VNREIDFFEAVKQNDLTTVKDSLLNGADVMCSDETGKTALDWAVELEHEECETLIRERRIKLFTESMDRVLDAIMADFNRNTYRNLMRRTLAKQSTNT